MLPMAWDDNAPREKDTHFAQLERGDTISVMDTITGALIGAAGRVVGALVQPILAFFRERPSGRTEHELLRTITVTAWNGYMIDVYRDDDAYGRGREAAQLRIEKTALSPYLRGSLFLKRFDGTKADVVLERGVLCDRNLMFHYRARDAKVKQMGTMSILLSDTCDSLSGIHAGWSPFDSCYVAGNMVLTQGP
ncbi:MAG: hypothetical protein NTW74_13985, partial [Acidobacteria bacterium]|nr:hypothetical protein [Acidobacteriota bacterium]